MSMFYSILRRNLQILFQLFSLVYILDKSHMIKNDLPFLGGIYVFRGNLVG